MRFLSLALLFCSICALGWTQAAPQNEPERNTPPPRSDDAKSAQPQLNDEGSESETQDQSDALPTDAETPHSPNDSSSRSTLMDLSPPTGDVQEHPNSDTAQGVNEMHPWNPHRAAKDIEVGDYYWNEKNYRGAEGRYLDALIYKPNDASATFRLAEIMEKTKRPEEAREFYTAYLKILPHGPKADDARKALEKLQAAQAK